ncbi:oligoribonuclease isoform X2 [Phalaenopsis equestris]|uniref:oligoribonuclease isoform X2 n=1 Tax=Phalaenopsis equestris TaxID=78828 RepID=UPI0009E1D44D|nr:oligoribonuclease isoform X2 [Phalaenopsis equestris]
MSGLSNVFSALNLDAEDDKEQIASLTTASGIDGCSKRISGEGDKQNYELTVKRAHSESDKSHNNIHPSLSSSLSGSYKQPLVWIDLEMTGLEIEVDRILEIACIITDGKLNKSVEGPDLVIKQSKECLDRMGEWCREHHAASGLTERVLQSTITEEDAEEQVLNFVKNYVGSETPLLAGNSVYVDYMFLKKYMPCLAGIFPHVLVDVSSITALCVRWFPKERKTAPTKVKRHRAMDDIKESIRELKYYKENIFKGFRKSK